MRTLLLTQGNRLPKLGLGGKPLNITNTTKANSTVTISTASSIATSTTEEGYEPTLHPPSLH
jgi:hypothetical protein